jgi:hypothetical protein
MTVMYPLTVTYLSPRTRPYDIQADQKGRAGVVSLDLQLLKLLTVASSLLSLQHARVSVSQHECSGILGLGYTILISYLSLINVMPQCLQDVVLTVPPYSFVLENPSTAGVPFIECWAVCPLAAFHLPPETHGRIGRLPKARCTYG